MTENKTSKPTPKQDKIDELVASFDAKKFASKLRKELEVLGVTNDNIDQVLPQVFKQALNSALNWQAQFWKRGK